jgi:hypothetical protein
MLFTIIQLIGSCILDKGLNLEYSMTAIKITTVVVILDILIKHQKVSHGTQTNLRIILLVLITSK